MNKIGANNVTNKTIPTNSNTVTNDKYNKWLKLLLAYVLSPMLKPTTINNNN